MCVAGGERVLKHNALRNAVFRWSDKAGLNPELEKPGLLLPQRPGDSHLGRRRPADVYLPTLAGVSSALDLAITAPQRMEHLTEAARRATSAAESYAATKASHLGTAPECQSQGMAYVPLVVESTGAWAPQAAAVLKRIARAAAARSGEEPARVHALLMQEMCIIVRGYRARAVLRRRAEQAA